MQLEENKDGPGGQSNTHHDGTATLTLHQNEGKSAPDLEFIASQNWYEGRPKDKIPERRAYHISFVHNNK
jgi:hypothetical protein